jgi:hypothetical protein
MALAVCSLVAASGCSCVSQMERANLTTAESRERYVSSNPGSQFKLNVANGEIVRGMSINDVVASWGLPNVYVVAKEKPREHWIYYMYEESTNSILEYTLSFSADTLEDWDVDQRRLSYLGTVTQIDQSRFMPLQPGEPSASKR